MYRIVRWISPNLFLIFFQSNFQLDGSDYLLFFHIALSLSLPHPNVLRYRLYARSLWRQKSAARPELRGCSFWGAENCTGMGNENEKGTTTAVEIVLVEIVADIVIDRRGIVWRLTRENKIKNCEKYQFWNFLSLNCEIEINDVCVRFCIRRSWKKFIGFSLKFYRSN